MWSMSLDYRFPSIRQSNEPFIGGIGFGAGYQIQRSTLDDGIHSLSGANHLPSNLLSMFHLDFTSFHLTPELSCHGINSPFRHSR